MHKHLSSAPVPKLPMAAANQRRSMNRKQLGMGFWGYIGVLLVVAAVITFALRLGPHYMNHRTVVSIVTGLGTNSVHQMEKRQIRELLKKRFKINTLYDLDATKIVVIDRTKKHTKLVLDYEVREPMVYNVDAVLKFKDEFEFR